MADRIADYDSFRGLLIQDPRITGVNTTGSVLTEAGPRPGVPVPQQATEMVVRSCGDQGAGGQLRVRTHYAGRPDGIAGFIWQNEGDADWRGWDLPTLPTHWEAVQYLDGTDTSNVSAKHLHAVTLADRSIVVAYELAATFPAARDMVKVIIRNPTTGAWGSPILVYTQTGSYSVGRASHPCMVQLPGGRLLLWHWVQLSSGSMQIRQHYSDDGGATWTVGSATCLPAQIDYTAAGAGATDYDIFGRLRAGYLDGDILLVAALRLADDDVGAGNIRDNFRQMASSDLGARFSVVLEAAVPTDSAYSGSHQDIVSTAGHLILGWGENTHSRFVRLGSAFEVFTSVATVWVSGGYATVQLAAAATSGSQVADSDFSMALADSGAIYALDRTQQNGDECVIGRSVDGGLTWEAFGQDATLASLSVYTEGCWFISKDALTHPRDYASVWHEGRVVVLHHWDANPGNEDNSIGALYLGGYSTVTMPAWPVPVATTIAKYIRPRVNWTATWLPIEKPQNVPNWAFAGGGATALTGGALNISTTAQQAMHTANPGGSNAQGLIVAGSVLENSGGSVLAGVVVCNVRVADGAAEYEVQFRVGTAGAAGNVKLTDVNGGDLGTETLDTSAGVDFLIAISDANVAWWVRPRSSASDRVWQAGTPSTTLTGAGGPAANHRIQFGHPAATTADSDWYSLHYVENSYTGDQLSTGQTNPDDLAARAYSGERVYVDAGTSVSATDGPTLNADEWDIDTRSDYAADRVIPTVAPSPRNAWRSIGTGQTKIAFALDPTITAASRSGNTVVGMAIMGANFRTFSIEGDTGGGSWSSLGTFDAAEDMASMAFVRSGNSLEADSGSTDTPYLFMNEAAAWTADLGGGNLRRVKWSSEGKWDQAGKRARIFCDGVDNSEAATGTMSLWPSDFTVILRLNNVNYSGYRLVIDSQSTVDGYHTIGSMVVGPVVVMGQAYSWGRVVETQGNVARSEAADWTDRVRKLSPARRVVQFGWQDGTDLTSVEADGTPDYLTTSTNGGTEPAASWVDTPYVMEGLVHLLEGGRLPLVYLPKMPKGAGGADSHMLNRRRSMVYARSTSPIRIETVLGTENTDEVVRVGQMVLTEIV